MSTNGETRSDQLPDPSNPDTRGTLTLTRLWQSDEEYTRRAGMSTNSGHESCDSAIDAYRTEIAALTAEVEQLRAALERIKRESGNPGFAPSAIAREALAVRG